MKIRFLKPMIKTYKIFKIQVFKILNKYILIKKLKTRKYNYKCLIICYLMFKKKIIIMKNVLLNLVLLIINKINMLKKI